MDYLFGTMRINNEMRHTLRIKAAASESLPQYETGTYHTHFSSYPDVTLTDSFKVERKIQESTDSENNRYVWYELSEYNRNIDRTPSALSAVEQTRAINSITFVTLAESGSIDAVTASEHMDAFAEWAYPVSYTVGQIRTYGGMLYRCVSAHTSQADWPPDVAFSLWTRIADPAEEWPAWSQPIGAHDAYQSGDKVSHSGKHWQSNTANNVWEPGVYGWDEVSD